MAIIVDSEGAPHPLRNRHLLGRSSRADSRVSSAVVSSDHALLFWTDGQWWLRDLGSRNGTFFDGTRLTSGEPVAVRTGCTVGLGAAGAVFTLVSDTPPTLCATSGPRFVEGADDQLALPSEDDPKLLVLGDREDGWLVLSGDTSRRAEQGMTLTAHGMDWTLHLPTGMPTTRAQAAPPEPSALALEFQVSADEEHVELVVRPPSGARLTSTRTHHYALLTLARARLADRDAGVGTEEEGWVPTEQLARQLRISLNLMHVQLHRARREVSDLIGVEAHDLVEVRRSSRQVRIGCPRVSVRRSTA